MTRREGTLDLLRALVRRVLPRGARRKIAAVATRATRWPPVGEIDFGDLRRTRPIGRDWGFDRGTPVDRYYITQFLRANELAIRGRVLEIDTNEYTRAFGGDRVTRSDVLHQSELRPGVTIVGDLTDASTLPEAAFDSLIVTQTLQLIQEPREAVRTMARILKPGGTVLSTFPGISRMTGDPEGRWGYAWGFTSLSARELFEREFGGPNVQISTYGNVLAAAAFLYGIAAEELSPDELDDHDPDIQMLLAVRAMKPLRVDVDSGI